jgi:hypothetical protein
MNSVRNITGLALPTFNIKDYLNWVRFYCVKNEKGFHDLLLCLSQKTLSSWLSNSVWIGKNIVWMGFTSSLVLVMPVLFLYEKECQMNETQSEMQKLYVQAHGPQLNT